ncbi:MAG: hypothetical protein WC357_00790 [Candidatus Omnitrophota bacterium]
MEKNIILPYLSIVTCSRNDDHGESMFKRMHMCLSSLGAQLERYKIESEIILVDYNPPDGKPLLKDLLSWPKETRYCSLRTVIVPASLHKRYPDSDRAPFNGALAFNTGLRRSRGQFALLMPIDNLLSNELVEFLAEKRLESDKFYRADRLDVSRKIMEIDSIHEWSDFCKKHVLWIHTRYGSIPVIRKKKHYRSTNLAPAGSGSRHPILHTNGPDIMLTSRKSWFLLRGYPEIDTYGLYLDGLLCYLAYYNGLKEEILPPRCCLFHIDHESRWRNIHPTYLERILFYCLPDIFALRINWIINKTLKKIFPGIMERRSKTNKLGFKPFNIWPALSEMQRTGAPIIFNSSNWGFGDEQLDEYTI